MLPKQTINIWSKIYIICLILLTAGVILFLTYTTNSQASENNLLTSPWHLTGNNNAAESYQYINQDSLKGQDTLKLSYNLHGTCLYGGDASAVVFDQPIGMDWKYVSLSNYGKNCFDGEQTVTIPLSDFQGLDTTKPVGVFHVRFWSDKTFNIDITNAVITNSNVLNASPTPIPTNSTIPTVAPTPTPQVSSSGYKAYYWNLSTNSIPQQLPQTTPSLTRSDNNIYFNWDELSPDPKIGNNHFAARWVKRVNFEAGTYDFISKSDDGIKVWIDDQLIINQWNDHPLTTYSAKKNLTSGYHSIKVEYYENTGKAEIQFSYSKTAVANTSPIPNIPLTTPTPKPIISTPNPTQTPVPSPSNTTSVGSWSIQSVSSMKETKDKICGQDSQAFINSWVDTAKELGANYIAVETPYDNPSCGDARAYTKIWVDTIRSRGLKVWHRHMPLAFEGIYNTAKSKSDFLNMISDYIKNNPNFFQEGDIFTPIPEPQNGGINGVTGCAGNVCQFDNAANFNQWLRNAMTTSNNAFSSIGLGGKMKVGYYGFDGFVAWGCNNPDWHGILEDATVQQMGNITIDHYPELIGQTMKQGLDELQAKYPNTPIVIGEWGSAATTDIRQQVQNSMSAAKRPGVIGFNYWHMGMGGNEALINGDFSHRPQFVDVQSFYKGTR